MTTPDRKTLIGRVFPDVTYVINAQDINDYVPVAEESHAAFVDDAGARRRVRTARDSSLVCSVYFHHWLVTRVRLGKRFYMDYKKDTAMFGEQELEYLRPLYVGETLTVHSAVSDVYEKKGKRTFDVAQITFTITDESGAVAMRGAQSYIIFK